MNWQRGLMLSVAAWLVLAGAGRAQTAAEAVAEVPRQALGFAVINNLEATNGKIEALAKRLGVPLPFTPLEKVRTDLGVGKSLNGKGSVLLVAMMTEQGQPAGVVYFPVTDYGEFVRSLGGKADAEVSDVQFKDGKAGVVMRKGSFAVATAAEYREAMTAAVKATPAGAALAPIKSWLAEQDASGVLMSQGIQMLTTMGRQGLGMAKGFAQNLPPEAQFLGDVIDGLDEFLKSVGSDVSNISLGLKLDAADNLSLGLQSVFVENSGFAKAGAAAKAPPGGPLAGLPDVPYAFAAGGALSEKAMHRLTNFGTHVLSAIAKDIPKDKLQKLEQSSEDMVKGLQGVAMLMGAGKGQQNLFESAYAVMKVADSKEYLHAYKRYIEIYDDVFKDVKIPGQPNQHMTAKDATVDGRPALEIQIELKGLDDLPEQQKKAMEMFYGPEGKITATAVAADGQTVLIRYAPPAETKQFLKEYRTQADRLGRDQEVAKAVALLPSGPQFIALLHPPGLIEFANRVLNLVPQAGGLQLPPFPTVPPIAIGSKLTATSLECRLVIPATTLEAIGNYARLVGQR